MSTPSGYVFTRKYVGYKPMDLPYLIDRKASLELAPISGINVGAVGQGSSFETAYLGINVEFQGLPLHHSIHAEQFLIANLMLNNETHLRFLAATANSYVFDAPCGQCLQILKEVREATGDINIFLMNPDKCEYARYEKLWNIFQRPFGPDCVQTEDSLPLLAPCNNGLTLLDPDSTSSGDICDQDSDGCDHLLCMALAAANRSSASYSKCPSGVALKDRDGKVYRGWYVESMAINPILGPVQMALVDFLTHKEGKGFDTIVEALLVEKKDAKVSQEKTTRMILETIASTNPKCDLKVVHCQ